MSLANISLCQTAQATSVYLKRQTTISRRKEEAKIVASNNGSQIRPILSFQFRLDCHDFTCLTRSPLSAKLYGQVLHV